MITGVAMFGALRALTPKQQIASPWVPAPSHLESVVWADLFGVAYLPLTRAEAMSVAPMARARHLVAGTIARLPLRDYRAETLTDPQPIWIDRSDQPTSAFHRMLWTVDDLLFYGWSLWQLERGQDNNVLAAQRIPYEMWDFDQSGLILIGGEYPAHPELLCLIPGMHEGLLNFAKRSIRHASNLVAGADRAAETPTPNLELHQVNDAKLTDDDIAKLVAQWAAARRGVNGGVAYTNSAIEVREHGAPVEALLLDGRNAAAVDIARSCGIPAEMIDAHTGSSLTYSTIEGRNRELIEYGLAPYMAAISARLGMDDITPRGRRIAFDLEEYLGVPGTYGAPDDGSGLESLPRPAIPAASPGLGS